LTKAQNRVVSRCCVRLDSGRGRAVCSKGRADSRSLQPAPGRHGRPCCCFAVLFYLDVAPVAGEEAMSRFPAWVIRRPASGVSRRKGFSSCHRCCVSLPGGSAKRGKRSAGAETGACRRSLVMEVCLWWSVLLHLFPAGKTDEVAGPGDSGGRRACVPPPKPRKQLYRQAEKRPKVGAALGQLPLWRQGLPESSCRDKRLHFMGTLPV
jgi:hypothetical protein